MSRNCILVIAVLLAVPATGRSPCLVFPRPQDQTLREVAAQSNFVVFVRVENNPNQHNQCDTSSLIIRDVLKDDPSIARRPVFRRPLIPSKDARNPLTLLTFGDVFQNKPDLFYGVVGGPALADYARGLLAVVPKGDVAVLRYCFDFLDSKESAVAEDALFEFSRATPANVARAARKFEPAKVRRWLADADLPPNRLSCYSFLLGNCGERQDAALLRALLDREVKKGRTDALSRICIGYILLDPTEGWLAVRKLAERPTNNFYVRCTALVVVRFFFTERPNLAKKDLLAVISPLLDQADIADLAVADLSKWRCWDLTERVIALADKHYDQAKMERLVRRSVIRYALRCPDPRCKTFLAEQRKKDPELVQDVEELHKLEEGQGEKLQ